MHNKVLITGGSGYLGGTVLNRLKDANLPEHKLYALVRTTDQAEAVQQYGAEPLQFDVHNASAVHQAILEKEINIVFFLLDAFTAESQRLFIKALGDLRKQTGQNVHFLHTSGAKMYSDHAGAPTDKETFDDDPNIYDMQKKQRATVSLLQCAVEANVAVIDECEALQVKSYIFLPCIVYGKSEGFGNPTSIQTVAIVKAAKGAGHVYKFDEHESFWPVSHVSDTATLYIALLEKLLNNHDIGCGRNGFYLASCGSMSWNRIYADIAKHMARRGVIKDSSVLVADDSALEKMATALGCIKELVAPQLSGNCALRARRGYDIGWKPKYSAEHILEEMEDEVALILESLK